MLFRSLSGTGVAILISIFLNILLPNKKEDDSDYIQHVDLAPSDITNNMKNITEKSKKIFKKIRKKKDNTDVEDENT